MVNLHERNWWREVTPVQIDLVVWHCNRFNKPLPHGLVVEMHYRSVTEPPSPSA